MNDEKHPLLHVQNLKKYFPITGGFFNRVTGHIRAVDGVSFDLHEGECLGLVGESGSGKTTVGRTILRALAPTAGKIQDAGGKMLGIFGEGLSCETRRQLSSES